MKEYMIELKSIEQFEEIYLSSSTNIFVFSASWCPDCRYIETFMPELVSKYSDYNFYYVDRDEFMALAQRWFVLGIPSFVAVRNGKEINRLVSKLRKTKEEIDNFLGEL